MNPPMTDFDSPNKIDSMFPQIKETKGGDNVEMMMKMNMYMLQ